ncbi:MAG: hypothetical protein SVZ03_13190 [Spirochaetota bacterium]|nr:hypothetical protein [Spirochaetota bacterium]
MENIILVKSVLMFIALWGLGIIFLWFRQRIEIFWKIIATLIFVFYFWFFFEEISTGYREFSSGWYPVTINFLKEFISLTFITLFFFWPLALVLIFYKANDIGAEKLLIFMCILTLILWVLVIIYVFYTKGVDEFLYEHLMKMIPKAKPSTPVK